MAGLRVSRTDRRRLSDLRTAVRSLYRTNRRRGAASWSGVAYDYVCPSAETYPFQWFWDSCFHAIVLSRLDIERAATELRTLLANQHPDGFVSHVTFWQRDGTPGQREAHLVNWRGPWLSDSMQPPVLAEAVAIVYRRGAGMAFLRDVLPAVRAYYDWCHRVRDAEEDGLIVILEPHESGMDQTPAFDRYVGVSPVTPAAFRTAWRELAAHHAAAGLDPTRLIAADRFVVADVLVNVLYAENQRALAELLVEAGDRTAAAEYRRRAARTASAVTAQCWDPDAGEFRGLAGRRRRHLPGGTVAGLLPLLLDDLPTGMADRLTAAITDSSQFDARYPVPSVARSHPAYRPGPIGNLLWRGPTWINTSWLVARGLRRQARPDLAERIEEASVALVERSGFREYYHPERGTGHGARGFGWSALAYEMLAGRLAGDRVP